LSKSEILPLAKLGDSLQLEVPLLKVDIAERDKKIQRLSTILILK